MLNLTGLGFLQSTMYAVGMLVYLSSAGCQREVHPVQPGSHVMQVANQKKKRAGELPTWLATSQAMANFPLVEGVQARPAVKFGQRGGMMLLELDLSSGIHAKVVAWHRIVSKGIRRL